MKEYYSEEDFCFVVVGETSAQDVYSVTPNINAAKEISGGWLLEYALQDGKYIHISFQGEKLIVSAIEKVSKSINNAIETEKKYYGITDFQSIIIGTSTVWDVYKIAHGGDYYAVSYGAFCDYPMVDGRFIRIKFYGRDMIVGDIEVISKTEDGSLVTFEIAPT